MTTKSTAKLKLSLKQLVRRDRPDSKPYYEGVVHLWKVDYGRTFCGRTFQAPMGYSPHYHLETPSIPAVTCIRCLDNFEAWKCKQRGAKIIRKFRRTTHTYIRSMTVEENR